MDIENSEGDVNCSASASIITDADSSLRIRNVAHASISSPLPARSVVASDLALQGNGDISDDISATIDAPEHTNETAAATSSRQETSVACDDTNRNVVVECCDVSADAHCRSGSSSHLESLVFDDLLLTQHFQEFEIFIETHAPLGKVGSIPASEQTSVYYDALETQEGDRRSGVTSDSSGRTAAPGRRKRRGAKWCCCCQKKGEDNAEDILVARDSADSDTRTTRTDDKATSATSTRHNYSRKTDRSTKVSSKAINVASGDFGPPRCAHAERRKRVPDRPDKSMSLWSVLKNAISKDISRSPLPVNFSEPLSMLQRLAEDYEYSSLLDKASKSGDQWEQLCFVAAFSVASYGNTGVRTFKPFNPLLGETYEMDRMGDLGWRYISEQVSHHPPTAATHCEGSAGWICWQDLTMHSKWHMNTCDFNPTGVTHVKFSESGHHYTWRKVTTLVHNIIWGKLWVDQVGDTVVTNHITGDTCKLQFLPTSGRSNKQVTGVVATKLGQVKWTLTGNWDDQLTATPSQKSEKAMSLWKMRPASPEADKYYYMTEFACQLNELEEGVAPTDSRLRPDQRLMEQGSWDEANAEKTRLEDKQRKEMRKWESDEERASIVSVSSIARQPYTPFWFKKARDETTSQVAFKYTNLYWERKKQKDWTVCPNIF